VLAWLRRLPEEALNGDVRLLTVAAWVLSLSARRQEAAQAIARIEMLGDPGSGPLPDGFSSAEASLTMLRAVCPWGDVGAQLEDGRRAAELEGPGSPWRPVACWAVGMGLYWRGDFAGADQWFTESAALAPASARWVTAGSSLAYRSLIAGENGRLEEQRLLAEQASQFVREHGIEHAAGEVPLALGISFARRGRPAEALPLINRGTAIFRSWGQPIDLAKALLRQVPVLRALGERDRSQAAIGEARLIIESCPDPGILTGRLKTLAPSPQPDTRPADEQLTERELRVLRLLNSDLSERGISQELYVSHNTVHSHVRSIYRKLGVSTRAHALLRTRELKLL
jgi:LuxR family maltose regulon positive regulatory protein